jgi:hypothetical protein
VVDGAWDAKLISKGLDSPLTSLVRGPVMKGSQIPSNIDCRWLVVWLVDD